MRDRLIRFFIYLIATGLGMFAYVYPLVNIPHQAFPTNQRSNELPLLMALLLGICLLVLIYEIQETRLNNKLIALLGVLIAINSVVRFIDLALPVLGGFSPVFFLIIVTGYIFGGRIGFLMGALTLLVSAFITGGVGPWLPNQMFTAGWVGMSAAFARRIVLWTRSEGKIVEILIIVFFGGIWGFLYGAITNLWFWPFLIGPSSNTFSANLSLLATLKNYGVYYLATSLIWDAGRAVGNILLLVIFGRAVIKILRRFQTRFFFTYAAVKTDEI